MWRDNKAVKTNPILFSLFVSGPNFNLVSRHVPVQRGQLPQRGVHHHQWLQWDLLVLQVYLHTSGGGDNIVLLVVSVLGQEERLWGPVLRALELAVIVSIHA